MTSFRRKCKTTVAISVKFFLHYSQLQLVAWQPGTIIYLRQSIFRETLEKNFVRSGIRTHAHIRGPEYSCYGKSPTLESGALDRSAILTCAFSEEMKYLSSQTTVGEKLAM